MRPLEGLSRRRVLGLLVGNILALFVLSFPAYGFIRYMDLHGVRTYMVVGATVVLLSAWTIWPVTVRRRGISGYLITLAVTYLTSVIAFAFAVHKLLLRDVEANDVVDRAAFVFLIGGLSTVGYWIPASVVNFFMLRRRAEPPSSPPDPTEAT